MSTFKCLMILSEKSSGSSALQSELSKINGVNSIEWTQHCERETLYWTKAASVLRLPQVKLVDSEVPFPPDRARDQIMDLLSYNIPGFVPAPSDDKFFLFGGWRALCERYGPVFLEKSPHHLGQWSAIELIIEFIDLNPQIEFVLVGLVRNPLSVLYSQFRRWRTRPEKLQDQWLMAYRNLKRLKGVLGQRLIVLTYEEMITNPECIQPLLDFCRADEHALSSWSFDARSTSKWREDTSFGFMLSNEVVDLAMEFGYREDDLRNRRRLVWPAYREFACGIRSARTRLGEVKRMVKCQLVAPRVS